MGYVIDSSFPPRSRSYCTVDMHGRLKVKTTEEQAEAKRLERDKKLRQYVTVTKAIFEKARSVRRRKLGQLDKEALELTSQILGANPDFATLWNFRREIFLHLAEETPDEMQALYKAELSFLESCLRVNPKSYGTWHHRCWVMEHSPEPDWARELELCGKFLESDERNFHCWDYRRFVVQRSQVAPQDELAFSDSLITRNFSNYSSWHYRSLLLPQLYPDAHQHGRITEEILLKGAHSREEGMGGGAELELVQNAFFTDPNDQSAWFYHRWLLGRVVRSGVHNALSPPKQRPLHKGEVEPNWSRAHDFFCQCFLRCELSVEKSTVLQSELESCKELQALEPENKWCLLTIILLMRALDPLVYEQETLSYFATLKAADPMRSAYLDDLRSKFLLENSILKMEYADARVVDLSQRGLTVLCHLEHLLLVTHMNLSENLLCSLPPMLAMMRCLEVLEADDNQIETLEGLPPLPRLEELSLCNNRIQLPSDLQPLASFPKLSHLNLQGNPLCQIPKIHSQLTALLPNVATILT
ncbi:hypothetical protein lerEdw1_010121 [Lerista edwardsae]|nr:hypothetical protein lerEdw1_010121 [Lerista edwardsae]